MKLVVCVTAMVLQFKGNDKRTNSVVEGFIAAPVLTKCGSRSSLTNFNNKKKLIFKLVYRECKQISHV